MVGIASFGGYLPRLRLSRKAASDVNGWFNAGLRAYARGERSICNWDEDTLTMAVEAARDCLGSGTHEPMVALHLATTTAPFQDRQNAAILAQALRLGDRLHTMDITASQRAATTGLVSAFDTVSARGRPLLFIASEKRRAPAGSPQELLFGDGAAALLLDRGDGAARFLGSRSANVDFVDHYRGQNREFDYQWEERWIRDEGYLKIVPPVIKELLAETGIGPGDIAHFCLPVTLPKVAQQIAAMVGIAESAVRPNLDGLAGDTGAAHALVMLVHALEAAKPGERILVASFGNGCDALLFEATGALPKAVASVRGIGGSLKARKEETNYARYLAFNDLVKLERGLRAETDKQTPLTTLYRKRNMLTSLIGGRCERCGTLQFPKSKICVNPNCGAR
ncbi:MAG TPA: 3-oxoacyl-[acyl-carrier-protein] synthase III C-terminal domain-containing protein, partial [Stellaceae bacterium]|nr:3-oxoacyl-[acyl-carrier-protein] synthase III C-terminal domain-containing protein [Stellaceae bacterium]